VDENGNWYRGSEEAQTEDEAGEDGLTDAERAVLADLEDL
jgi:hypothetical protein